MNVTNPINNINCILSTWYHIFNNVSYWFMLFLFPLFYSRFLRNGVPHHLTPTSRVDMLIFVVGKQSPPKVFQVETHASQQKRNSEVFNSILPAIICRICSNVMAHLTVFLPFSSQKKKNTHNVFFIRMQHLKKSIYFYLKKRCQNPSHRNSHVKTNVNQFLRSNFHRLFVNWNKRQWKSAWMSKRIPFHSIDEERIWVNNKVN